MERINLDKSQLIKVGSTVYLKPINNAARYGRKDILEKVVLKICWKYGRNRNKTHVQIFFGGYERSDRI